MAQKEDSCTVGIVTFNPDAIRLKANIDNILKNTTKANIVVADNGSKNIDEIKNIIASNPQIVLLPLNENKGIAFALNRIFEKAIEQHHDWVLTLDQDSVAQPNLIDVLMSYKQKQGVGILCPRIEDRNMGRQYATNTYSGSCQRNVIEVKNDGKMEKGSRSAAGSSNGSFAGTAANVCKRNSKDIRRLRLL